MSGPTNPDRKLLKETRWSRRYQIDSYDVYESKIAEDDEKLHLADVILEWESWEIGERLEFVRAFSHKSSLSGEDERIVEFLINQKDERILAMMALPAILHSNKDLVLEFLLRQIQSTTKDRVNFIHALTLLGDSRAVSVIRDVYQQGLEREFSSNERAVLDDETHDFMMACIALWKLTGNQEYLTRLQVLQIHGNERIRRQANLLHKIWCQA